MHNFSVNVHRYSSISLVLNSIKRNSSVFVKPLIKGFFKAVLKTNEKGSDSLKQAALDDKTSSKLSLLRAKAGSKLEYKYRLLLEKPFFAVVVPWTALAQEGIDAVKNVLVSATDFKKIFKLLKIDSVAKFPAFLYAPEKIEDLMSFLEKKKDMICSLVKLNSFVLQGSDLLMNGLFLVMYKSFYDLLQNLFLTPGYFASNLVEVSFD